MEEYIEEKIKEKENSTKINSFIPSKIKNNNNIEFMLMEKDKKIIELSNINKNLNEKIEALSIEIKNKNIEISSLKEDINSYNNDKKIFEQEISNYQKEISNLNRIIQEKNKKMEEIVSKNNISEKKMNALIDTQKNEYNEMSKDYQKMQNVLVVLNNKILSKDKIIDKLENTINKNKEKNSKIIILNKEIKEKNDLINNLQLKLGNISNELKISKSCDDENINKLYNNDNNEKNSIISFVIEKIQDLILYVDDDNNFGNNTNNLNDKIIEIKEDFILYDLIEQNILLLKNKIYNKYNNIIIQNKEYKNLNQLKDNKISELSNYLEQLKGNNQNKNKSNELIINQMQQTIKNRDLEINKLNKKIFEFKANNSYLITENQFNDFYNNFLSKINENNLREFNLRNYTNINDSYEGKLKNIINIIDFMNKKIKHLNNFVKEYENYKNKVNKIINQNLNRSNGQNSEIKELKSTIKDLNDLLEQSNIYLKQSRNENELLKKRNLNLEKTINMISKNNTLTISNSNKENLLNNNNANDINIYPPLEQINEFN